MERRECVVFSGLIISLRWGGGVSMDSLVSGEGILVFHPGGDGRPVDGVENGGYMLVCQHSHQDPSCRVLDLLKPRRNVLQ